MYLTPLRVLVLIPTLSTLPVCDMTFEFTHCPDCVSANEVILKAQFGQVTPENSMWTPARQGALFDDNKA